MQHENTVPQQGLNSANDQRLDEWLGDSYGEDLDSDHYLEIASFLAGALEPEGVSTAQAVEIIEQHGMDVWTPELARAMALELVAFSDRGSVCAHWLNPAGDAIACGRPSQKCLCRAPRKGGMQNDLTLYATYLDLNRSASVLLLSSSFTDSAASSRARFIAAWARRGVPFTV